MPRKNHNAYRYGNRTSLSLKRSSGHTFHPKRCGCTPCQIKRLYETGARKEAA